MKMFEVIMHPDGDESEDNIRIIHMRAENQKAARSRALAQAFDVAVAEARNSLSERHDDDDVHDLRGDFSKKFKLRGNGELLVQHDSEGEPIRVSADPEDYLEVTNMTPYVISQVKGMEE